MFKKGDLIVIKSTNHFHDGYYAEIVKIQGNGADRDVSYYVEVLTNKSYLWLLSSQMVKPDFKIYNLFKLDKLYV